MTKEELKEIAEDISTTLAIFQKDILTADEAVKYMGVSRNYLYKLTSARAIPFFKPNGKMVYFRRADLDRWMTANPVASREEIEQKAQAYCLKKRPY